MPPSRSEDIRRPRRADDGTPWDPAKTRQVVVGALGIVTFLTFVVIVLSLV